MKEGVNTYRGSVFQIIFLITAWGNWIFFIVWGTITNNQQFISAAERTLLLVIFIIFCGHQITNLKKYLESWTQN